MFIDSHCHLSIKDYENIDDVIKEANENNVGKLIVSGCDKESIKESIEIAEKYDNVYLSLGFHPSEANEITEEDITWLKEIIKNNKKVVAVGEIGLDYYLEKENKEKQKNMFEKMLLLAKEVNLPVVIHSRDAFQDTYDILEKNNVSGVIHCFSGNLENAKKYIKLGFTLGIGGVITFKNTNLKEVIKNIELENIILETDSPYLAPTPHRGNQNTPKYIPLIAEEIANLKQLTIEEVMNKTTENVKKIFKII